MIEIAIIDDNEHCAGAVENGVRQVMPTQDYCLKCFHNPKEFVNATKTRRFDIVLMDIILGTENGIEFAAKILKTMPGASIIFISANSDFYQDVYKVEHAYFLIKPIDNQKLKDAIQKCMHRLQKQFMMLEFKGEISKVYFKDVIYIESNLRKVILHLKNESSICKNGKLSVMENKLPHVFARCQQSFIVNLEHIQRIKNDLIYLNNGKIIKISKARVVEFKNKYTKYLGG